MLLLNKVNRYKIMIFVLLFFSGLCVVHFEQFKSNLQSPSVNSRISTLHEDHPSITINGNLDFHHQARTEGWDLGGTRDGSPALPYLLQDLSITDSLQVENTDVSFQVSSCMITEGGAQYGIYFRNVSY